MKASAIIEDVTIRARSEGVEATAAAAERLATAGDAVVASSERQTRSTLSVERAYERLQRQIDASYRQTQLFEQGQRTLDRALQQNLISTDAHQRSLGLLQARYASAGAAVNDNAATMSRFERQTGLASHQVTNLGYQLNDVAVSLAGGQSPFTVLFQQGSQILPILSAAPGGVGGALLGIGSYLVGLVNPATVAAAALLGIGTTAVAGLSRYGAETEALRKSLTGVGASTASTVDGLSRIAAGAAATGKVTESMARDVAAALAATGKIGVENFEGIIARTKDFASVMGLDAKEATEKLASAFSDPVKGADDLNQQLGFLSDKTRQYIVDLANQNDRTGAQKALLDALGPSLDDAANRTTALGRAWNFVASAASAAATAMAKAINGPSDVELLNAARNTLESAKQNRGKLGPLGFLAATESDIKGYEESVASLQEKIRQDGARSAAIARDAAARTLSIEAGQLGRTLDPVNAKFDELKAKRDKLGAALTRPEDLANVEQVRTAYNAYDRAVSSLTDNQGKLISSSDLLRQKDELAIAAKKADTDAEKATIAEKQKALDLVGEVITKEDAARRVAHAGALERIKDAKDSGSSAKDAADAFDNALQRSKDQIEELRQQQEQASRTTAEVYKLTEANKLRRAAASAGRSDEVGITEAINAQAEAYAKQRIATEQAIEAQKRYQESVRETAESVAGFVKDLVGGKGLDSALKSLGQTYLNNSLDALLTGKGPLAGALGLSASEKGGTGGLLGLLTGNNLKPLTDAISKGASQGVEGGFSRAASNDNFSVLGSIGIDGKQLAGGLTAIAGLAGAYGTGAAASSTGVGIAGGALSGALSGAALGSVVPVIGTAIGAIAGAIAGGGLAFLGGSSASQKAKAEREKQAQDNYAEAKPQIASLGSQLRGDPQGTIAQNLADAEASARKLGDVAFFAGRYNEQIKLYGDFLTYKDRILTEFRATFNGLTDALASGLGPDSAFGQSRDAVKSLGDQLKVFIDNTKTTFAEASPEVDRAREASRNYALAVLDGEKSLSTVATRMQEIRGASAGLQQVLTDLGMSAEDAATAIDQRATAALARLKASFESDLQRKTFDAQDRGYINETTDLIKELASLRTDAASLGTDQGLVTDYFKASAQKIVDGAQLTGSAFDDLIARFPELTGNVHAFQEAIDSASKAAEIASRSLGYQDRLFAALNDTTTLEGQLAAFDRTANRDREAEIKAGGEAIADLQAAQDAERFNIIKSFNQQAIDNQKKTLEEAKTYLDKFRRTISEYLDGLRAGSNSPLKPEDRLIAAQSQYNTQLGLAQGGNRDALDGITSYANDLIDAAKGFYASSTGFQTIFAQIQSQLGALPDQISAEQLIVNAIDNSRDALLAKLTALDLNGDGIITQQEAANTWLATIFHELDINGDAQLSKFEQLLYADGVTRETIRSAIASGPQQTANFLSTYFNALDTSVDGVISFQEMQTALGGMASNASLRDMFTRLDNDNSGGLSKLELIKNATQGTEIYSLQNKQVLDTLNSVLNSANQLTATSNSLIDYSNLIGNNQSALLNAIQGLQATSAQQLQLLNSQLTAQTNVTVQGQTVYGNLVDNIRKIVYNTSSANQRVFIQGSSGAVPWTFAGGGLVEGPGSATSDSISARLSNGEFVMRAAAVDRFGVGLLNQMNDNFATPALAVPVPVGGGNQSNAALIAEIKALRAEVAALRSDTRAGASLVATETRGVKTSVEAGNAVARDNNKRLRRDRAA